MKHSQYAAKETSDDLGTLSDKLASDLRRSIRQLGSFPVLSEYWNQTADTFGRVATISDMESKLSASKTGATLWETEELALRYLLEDGKLNLTLRNLMDYKEYQRARFLESHNSGSPLKLPPQCDLFEKGVGVVLRNAWNHVEVLQTTDLPALLCYISDVLNFANENPDFQNNYTSDLHQRQEVLVFYYMWGLFKNIEDIGEGRVMPVVRSRGLFALGVKWLVRYHRCLLSTHVLKAAESLALIADSEDFSTYKDAYVPNREVSEDLQQLKLDCLSAFQTDMDVRRKLRPLLDATDQAKRKFGSK